MPSPVFSLCFASCRRALDSSFSLASRAAAASLARRFWSSISDLLTNLMPSSMDIPLSRPRRSRRSSGCQTPAARARRAAESRWRVQNKTP